MMGGECVKIADVDEKYVKNKRMIKYKIYRPLIILCHIKASVFHIRKFLHNSHCNVRIPDISRNL